MRFFITKKLHLCLFAIALSLIIATTFFLESKEAYAERLVPIYRTDRKDNKIAISFDAAWGADKTLKILDKLDEYNVKATFFLVEFWAEKYPEICKEIYMRGHEIGSHSCSHPHFNSLSEDKMKKEIDNSIKTLENITGATVKCFRFPFGEYNNQALAYLSDKKILPIQWDVDSLDWKGLSAKDIASRVLPKTKSGSIILCHNNSDNIVEALDIILPALLEKGFTFVKMSDLAYSENYTIDNNGVQKAS